MQGRTTRHPWRFVAAILAAIVVAAGLVTYDTTRAGASSARATGDCTRYGSGCLGDWSGYQHGVDGDPATADVLVVGDSIVNRCRTYLRLRLAAYGLTSVFDYWSSRPTADRADVPAAGAVTRMLSYSRIYQPESFKAVWMLSGTNDIFDPTVMTAEIDRAKVIDSPLGWGTVYAARSGTYSADLRNTGWVNQQITGAGIPVSDWFGFLAGYPGYRIPNHVPDGVHPDYGTGVLLDGSGCDAWAAIHAPRIAQAAS